MSYDRDQDMYSERLSIDDVSDYDAMGHDAAPRMTDAQKVAAGWKVGRYSYLMTERPFSIGCQPKAGFVSYEESELPKADSGYYGILTYNRELTTEEIQRYELVEMASVSEVV